MSADFRNIHEEFYDFKFNQFNQYCQESHGRNSQLGASINQIKEQIKQINQNQILLFTNLQQFK